MRKAKNQGGELSSQKPERHYEVGYAKPPAERKFKPGRSGNPAGRPRGSKNKVKDSDLTSIVLEEAQRSIKINDGGRSIKLSVARAVVRAIGINALKGNVHAQRRATELLHAAQQEQARIERENFSGFIDYKIWAEQELERRARLGLKDLPEIIPHPDQITIDIRNNQIWFVDPWTKEEKAQSIAAYEEYRDDSRQMVQFIKNRLAGSEEALEAESSPTRRKRLIRNIQNDIKVIKNLKRSSEELLEKVRPWGFVETRDLWGGEVELKFPWAS
ncbi:DUF5681 domain-containing protein [Mesorhizobium sp. M0317]|uniref:DUF5681 domain-containing protein n=1 Tax=Mesorhizobium sp. M0317 TaxID=2956935 RepID=UPI003339CAE7